jgi:hypothetical protein
MLFKQKVAWKEAAWIFGLSRLTFLLFWYLCVTFIPMFTPAKYIALKQCRHITTNISCFLLSWWDWDAIHYIEIAHSGYTMLSNTVYFPFFPLLIHSVGLLFGGSTTADYAAGLILANTCFYGVLVLFYLLVSQDFGHVVAKYAMIYLAFAPYALFFCIGYTESLFLLLTLAVFLFLHRGKASDWWLAGLCGFLGALTRPTGIILIVPFLVMGTTMIFDKLSRRCLMGNTTDALKRVPTFTRAKALSVCSAYKLADEKVKDDNLAPPIGNQLHRLAEPSRDLLTNGQSWKVFNALLATALVPAGLLTYMLYLWMTKGNPLVFTAQEGLVWHHYTALPWVGMFNAIQEIVRQGPSYVSDTSDVILTLIPILALIIGWKLLPLDYSLFSLMMILFVLCEPRQEEPLLSVPRYLLVVFPLFILLGIWSQNRRTFWHLMLPCLLLFIAHVIQYAIYSWSA